MVLDVGATAQELIQLTAAHLQMTVDEIRERIAYGSTIQAKQEKRHIVTV